MRRSNITATFASNIEKVWDIVTNNSDYVWRSDLSRIETIDEGNSFIEYTTKGHWTKFTITCKEIYKRYEFDMENDFFRGHWTGLFEKTDEGGTIIEFTEILYIKKPVMELLSYIGMPLKKIQKRYIADLRRKLGE